MIDALAKTNPPVSLKQASRAIGRNDAYLQQFLYRGTPRQLPELARHRLASYLGIDQRYLMDTKIPISGRIPLGGRQIAVPFLNLAADAGGGTHIDVSIEGNDDSDRISLPRHMLHRLGSQNSTALRMITIRGDSMAPKLEHDDLVMVDCSQQTPSPPGIFILYDGVGLVAKQIEIIPNSVPQKLLIRSENPAYRVYQRRIDEIQIIGRVIWFGRRL